MLRNLSLFLIFIFFGLASSGVFAVPGVVVSKIDSPGPCPTGLAFDGKHLWVTDRKADRLYKLDTNGKVLKTFSTPGYKPSGLAYDGEFIWVSDLEEGKLFKIDTKSGYSVKVIDSPTPAPSGLAWDGKNLWVADYRKDMLVKVDQKDGTALASFKAPAGMSTDIAFDGKYLWVADRKEDMIFLVSPEHESVIFSFKAPGPYTYGLAFDGEYLWNVDYENKKIYKLVRDDGKTLQTADSKKERIQVTSFIMNYGPSRLSNLKTYLAVPAKRDNQKLLTKVAFKPAPKKYIADQYGQKFALFEFSNIKAGKKLAVEMSMDVEVMSVKHYVYPDKVQGLSEVPKDIAKLYLKDAAKFDIENEFIRKKVGEVVGDETNPYWIARKLYDWLIGHMEYKLAGGWETAPQVLKRGSGSCSEYTFSYLALTRAAGMPSRYVGSYVIRGDDASWDDVFHRWAEIYLPGYGWIPVDPNAGDKEELFKQAKAFGGIDNRFLISTAGGGDSKYLDWTYNVKQEWVATGTTKVRVEDVAEWSPLKSK